MNNICDTITQIKAQLPEKTRLIAVSKYHPAEAIRIAYEGGQRLFGESIAQEIREKYPQLPNDIEWHFIGTLQTNKIKYIAPFVSMIHSIDSLRLLTEVNKAAFKNDRIIDCLLEIRIATEETKHGMSPETCQELLEQFRSLPLNNIRICGLMGMATFDAEERQIRSEFRTLKMLFDTWKERYFAQENYFKEISMGMSNDYPIAIEEGSTLIRVGTAIFGEREY